MKKIKSFMPLIVVLLSILLMTVLCLTSCNPPSKVNQENTIIEKCVILKREIYQVTTYKLLRVSDNTIHHRVIRGPQLTVQDTVLVAFDKRTDYETNKY